MSTPASSAPPPQIPKSKSGCACCAMGCTTMFVAVLVGLALLLGVTIWGFGKVINVYTSAQPLPIETQTTDADFTAANDKFNRARDAARIEQSVSVAFTAAELNALIARHPDFADLRGKARVGLAGSVMTLDLSVPLREIDLPKIRDRWLNGTARFGLIYHDGNFNLMVRSLTANGREFPVDAMGSAGAAFINEQTNDYFTDLRRENARSNDFWENVKTLAVTEDQLVLTTKGPAQKAGTPSEETEPSPTPLEI